MALNGWWSPKSTVESVSVFYRCPKASACRAGQGGVVVLNATDANGTAVLSGRPRTVCKEGTTGRLCTECSPGYFSQFGSCERWGQALTTGAHTGAHHASGAPVRV